MSRIFNVEPNKIMFEIRHLVNLFGAIAFMLSAHVCFCQTNSGSEEEFILLMESAKAAQDTSYDTAIRIANKALHMADQAAEPNMRMRAHDYLVTLFVQKVQFDSADLHAQAAMDIAAEQSDSIVIAEHALRLGQIKLSANENDESFHLLVFANGIAQRYGDADIIVRSYTDLGRLVIGQHDVMGAIEYLSKALSYAERDSMMQYAMQISVNLSILHDSVAMQKLYLSRAITIAEKYDFTIGLSQAYSMLAYIELAHEENPEEGIALYRKSLDVSIKINQPYQTSKVYYDLGIAFHDLNQFDSASLYLNRLLDYTSGNRESYQYFNALRYLASTEANLNNYAAAYDSLSAAYSLSKKYYDKNIEDQLLELNTKYETAEKERQIISQHFQLEKETNKRKQLILYSSLAISLMLLSGLIYFYFMRRKKMRVEYQLELERMKQANLKEIDALKSRWFENISHDIRTPLTLISGPLRDLSTSVKGSSNKFLLDIAHNNCQKLARLSEDMLELARLENNAVPLRRTTREAFIELSKLPAAFDSYARERQIEIKNLTDIPEDTLLSLDYDKYEKIFNNLLKNAIKFSPDNSSVHVHINYSDNTLITKIVDQGPGIPSEDLSFVFDKYFRSAQTEVDGSGLGLSIVKELVDVCDGKIDVSTSSKGSSFTFSIPAFQSSLSDVETSSPNLDELDQQPDYISFDQSRILLVEDNPEMATYLQHILKSRYKVEHALRAPVAINKLNTDAFDLIISDIMMPGMDGFTFKKRVNTLTEHRKTPFIFLSAKALDEDKLMGLSLGVDDYITKPFVAEELIARVNNLLRQKRVRQHEKGKNAEDHLGPPLSEDSIVQRATTFVKENQGRHDLSVDDLAAATHYSPRQLNRILKKETGLTTVQFILEIRLQQARKYLISGQYYSVKEVGHAVGLTNKSYFSRKYTERFGSPPSSAMTS